MGSEGHSTLNTQHSRHVSTRVPHDDRRSSGVVFVKVGDAGRSQTRHCFAIATPRSCHAAGAAGARSLVDFPVHHDPGVLCQIVPCDLFHGDVRLRRNSSIDARRGIRLQAAHHVPRVGAGRRPLASLENAVKSDRSEPPKFVCGLLGVSHWSLWSVSGLTAAARRPAIPIPRAEYVSGVGVVTKVE